MLHGKTGALVPRRLSPTFELFVRGFVLLLWHWRSLADKQANKQTILYCRIAYIHMYCFESVCIHLLLMDPFPAALCQMASTL